MSRRGTAFNRNISSSSVGQRRVPRPIVTNNYIQQQNQPTPQRQHATQPTAQQHVTKQQPMFVQKKQQLAQQQQQQKQQLVQQKPQLVIKQQLVVKQQLANKQQQEQLAQQKKELDLKKQRDLEIQKQKDLEQQKQKELEQQKQQKHDQQLELQKQKELELHVKQEFEIRRQSQIKKEEQQNQEELDFQMQEKLQQQNLLQNEIDQQQLSSEIIIAEDKQLRLPILQENEIMENVSENRPAKRKMSSRRKLSKYEIQRRRNFRLAKLLKPKNAMVVLNEVVGNVTYNVYDCESDDGNKYRATAVVDGVEHEGLGFSKGGAKNNVAEQALKYLVKHKKLMKLPKPEKKKPPTEAEAEAMDTSEKGEIPLAWQQFASYAVFKLLASWGENPYSIKEVNEVVKKPSRKIPDNANLLNPLMLLNQMLPRQAHFEELPTSTSGTVTYSYKCTVNDQTFVATGTSKKFAKKQVAFEVCRNILGIEYPPEVYTPPLPTSA